MNRRAVALVLSASVLVACGDDDAAAPTGTTERSTTTTTRTTTTTTHPAAAVDVDAALLDVDDLPEGWAPADEAVGDVDPATAFCGEFVSVRALEELRTRPFAAGEAGPWVVSGVAVFESEQAAITYLGAVDDTVSCGTWTDGSGVGHEVLRIERVVDGADGSGSYEQSFTVDDTSFSVDVVYLRVDRALAFVTRTRRADAAPDDATAVDLDALVATVVDRLAGAVAP